MTEEEVQRVRERDIARYAKKVAGKKAAEKVEKAAILKGTKYDLQKQEELPIAEIA